MSSSFEYVVRYDDSFEDQVRKGEANPLCDMRIEVNGEDIKGAPEGEYYIDDFAQMHFVNVLSALPEVADGNRVSRHFYSHSSVLVLDPHDSDVSIAVVVANEVDKITPVDMATAEKREVISEIIRAADEFVTKALAINPELETDDGLTELQETIASTKGQVEFDDSV